MKQTRIRINENSQQPKEKCIHVFMELRLFARALAGEWMQVSRVLIIIEEPT